MGLKISPRKVSVLLTEEEIRSVTHSVFYVEPFIQWRKKMPNCQRKSLASETPIDIKTSNWLKKVDKNDKMLPEEIQKLVNTEEVKKNCVLRKNYKITCLFHGAHE